MREYLVFVRAGKGSLHPQWLAQDPQRNWDCCVNAWGEAPSEPGGLEAEWHEGGGLNKFEGFLEIYPRLLAERPYRYVLMLDDDLAFAPGDLSRFFPDHLLQQMIGMPADAVHRLVASTCGATLELDRLFAEATQHLEAFVQAGLLRVKPGVHDLLDALDALGLPRAVATSSSRHRARHHLQVAGLLDRLGPLFTRDDVPRGKPHPDLYLAAARHLNQPPAHCLAFEDSYNGVRAAAAAGMPVIMVPDLLPATAEMQATAVQVLASLHEARALFAQPAQPAQSVAHRSARLSEQSRGVAELGRGLGCERDLQHLVPAVAVHALHLHGRRSGRGDECLRDRPFEGGAPDGLGHLDDALAACMLDELEDPATVLAQLPSDGGVRDVDEHLHPCGRRPIGRRTPHALDLEPAPTGRGRTYR